MPSSKNKRKNGKQPPKGKMPKRHLSPFRLRSEDVAEMKRIFRLFELIVEVKLHKGECDEGDMLCLRDFFNLAQVSFAVPEARSWLDAEAVKSIYGDLNKAVGAVAAVKKRGDESGSYVCTSEELNLIRDMAEVTGELVQMSLENCPRRLLKEWCAMKELCGGKSGRLEIDSRVIEQTIERF